MAENPSFYSLLRFEYGKTKFEDDSVILLGCDAMWTHRLILILSVSQPSLPTQSASVALPLTLYKLSTPQHPNSALKMETCDSEMLVSTYKATQCHIPEKNIIFTSAITSNFAKFEDVKFTVCLIP
jgi:hypothetical protein